MFYQRTFQVMVVVLVLIPKFNFSQNSRANQTDYYERTWGRRNKTEYEGNTTISNYTEQTNEENHHNENEATRRRKRAEEERQLEINPSQTSLNSYWDGKMNRAFGIVGFLALLLVIISTLFYCRIKTRLEKKHEEHQQSSTISSYPELQSISNDLEEQDEGQRVNYSPSNSTNVTRSPGHTENMIRSQSSESASLPPQSEKYIVITADVNSTVPIQSQQMEDDEQDRNMTTTVETVLADVRC